MSTVSHSTADANETALGRAVFAFAEALESAGVDDAWMTMAVRDLAAHFSSELIVVEQLAGRPLSWSQAARFLSDIAEGKV